MRFREIVARNFLGEIPTAEEEEEEAEEEEEEAEEEEEEAEEEEEEAEEEEETNSSSCVFDTHVGGHGRTDVCQAWGAREAHLPPSLTEVFN